MTTYSAMSGENDRGTVGAVSEFLKEWGHEDDILSSPTQDNEDRDETDEVSEDEVLSEETDEDETVEQTEADDVDTDEDGSESVAEAKYASDTDKIKYRFNGEELEISVGEVKRLAGQEQALQHRSKDVAALERRTKELHDRAEAVGEAMYADAVTKFKAWESTDWAHLLKTLDSSQYNYLYAEYQKDANAVQFFGQSLDRVVADRRLQAEQELHERSAHVMRELSDPETGIKDFSQDKLAEIGRYFMDQGVPQDRLGDVFHSPLLRIAEKARLYDLAQKAKTTPVVKTPKKIVKNRVAVEVSRTASNGSSAKKAMAELNQKGGKQAAINALLASWNDD